MAGSIVEDEEPSCESICLGLEDVDRFVNLADKIIGCEPAIAILASLENDASITGNFVSLISNCDNSTNSLFIIHQPPPLRCQKIRNHQ
jgi:hypothetical protein